MDEKTKMLFDAIEDQDEELVEKCLNEGANVNEKDKYGAPLHMAAFVSNKKILTYLIKAGAEVNEKRSLDEHTALHIAASHGYIDLVKCLIEEGSANTEEVDWDEKTPLHLAAEQGYLDIVKYLAEEGKANLNALDKDGTNASYLAAEKDKLDIVKYLVEEKKVDFFRTKGSNEVAPKGSWIWMQ